MTTTYSSTAFEIDLTDKAPERNLPQKVGRRLWLPMLLMALMAFPVGVIIAIVRADEISAGGSATTIATLGHLVPGFMFLGFAAVFAAISFAIARILGELRVGGGQVQEAAGAGVETLKMPATAKAFIGLMMVAMMTILAGVVAHFVVAGQVSSGSLTLVQSEQWAAALEGVRRAGVAVYLFAIALGLGTIIHVLRFQAVRVRELAKR